MAAGTAWETSFEGDAEEFVEFSLSAVILLPAPGARATGGTNQFRGGRVAGGPLAIAAAAVVLAYVGRELNQKVFATYTMTHMSGTKVYAGRTSGKNMSADQAVRNRSRSHTFLRAAGFKDAELDQQLSASMVPAFSCNPISEMGSGAIAYGAIRGREQDLVDYFRNNTHIRVENKDNPIWEYNPNRGAFMLLSKTFFGEILTDPRH